MVARMTAKKLNYRMCFSLSGPPLIQNKSPNQSLGTLTIRSQKGPYKNIPTFLGLKRSTDAADYEPTRHVNQFHHPISQPWPNFGPLTFLASTKLASQSIFCRLAQSCLHRVWLFCFIKECCKRYVESEWSRKQLLSKFLWWDDTTNSYHVGYQSKTVREPKKLSSDHSIKWLMASSWSGYANAFPECYN